jgi:hypothetical protein
MDKINNSLWGQMDSNMVFIKEMNKKAGIKDEELEEEEFFKEPVKPKPILTQAELDKEATDKMRLFSEFVAADAEASQPVIKKEDPMKKPLHFKFYANEGEDEETVMVD